MAAAPQKLKINSLAKDLEMKSKELVDFLTEIGIAGKTSSASLEPDEFSLFFDALTSKNQITDMGDYLSGKAVIELEKPKEEIKEEPKTAPVPEKTEVKPAEEKPTAENRAEEKPAEKTVLQKQEPAAQTPASQPKTQAPQMQKAPEKKPAPQPPKQVNQIQQQPRNSSKAPDRFVKPTFEQKKPAPQKPNKPADQNKTDRGATILSQKTTSSGSSAVDRHTVLVDTRTTQVDLSKYDEHFESFVPESARRANMPDRQKLKKQQQKNPYASKGKEHDKDRQNMERMRREQMEKAKKQPLKVSIPDEITVGELASRLKVTASEVVKRLIMMGVMASVNQTVDFDTAYLVADELGAEVTREVVVTIEEKLFDETEDKPENLITREPVVCVMGHVDHGKTSLLDAIRHTRVTAGEAGGITQAIGAYRASCNGKFITFLDTPGHAAFTAMRARGAKSTDIAILVVAADDGIMPQTVEAINHAKAAGISIIVAINKMDKPTANAEAVKQELTKYDLVPEEWGGDTICVPVSALTKKGIPELLEMVLLVAEVKDLKANPNRRAKGIVIEAKLDKGRGPVATVLVQNGTLHAGDTVIAGTSVGRVRLMTDDMGRSVKSAGPSVPVEIVGLDSVPMAGDEFNAVEDERMARTLAEQRRAKEKEEQFKANSRVNLDALFDQIKEGVKDLNIIVKADVKGSAEAVQTSLEKLSNDEVHVKVIHSAVGGITEGDVMLAAASNAIIIGFNVRPDKQAMDNAESQKVDIRTYRVIYECIEEIEAAIKGMLKPVFREVVLGHAEVRQTIHISSVGTIAGSYVQDGKITRSAQIRVVRDGIVIFEDKIASLRRFKDDVREVASGYECGIGLEKFNDIKEGDVLEAFTMEEIKRD